MTEELAEKALAVVAAALRWTRKEREENALAHVFPKEHTAGLLLAVRNLEEALITTAPPNEPTGFIFTRTWAEVPAGWFVQGPGTPGRNIPAPWFEVVATRTEDGKQWVSLRVNGEVGEWPRDPAAVVRVKKGTRTVERDTALDVLTEVFGSVQVLADGGQFS